jgi:hypothetical protein
LVLEITHAESVGFVLRTSDFPIRGQEFQGDEDTDPDIPILISARRAWKSTRTKICFTGSLHGEFTKEDLDDKIALSVEHLKRPSTPGD